MSVMVQIRNVPESLHRDLKPRAAMAGMSLSEFLLREVRHLAERPTLEEMRARLKRRAPVRGGIEAADVIRELRDRG